ncbi:hypothetical protein FNAPI_9027 [Fusarium napiforme]|uniref:Uncharacterized protein n=1 Tax=Fusarium napiforme TaxID=42672 RepID=A0A8H5IZ46_9HYPO|nr:hypothetical protein FNAPI_9027 [Fusarium napiforme]
MNINFTPTAQSLETDLSGAVSRSHDNTVRYEGWLVRQPSSIGESANEIGLETQGKTVYATEHMLARVPLTEVSELRRDEKDERVVRYAAVRHAGEEPTSKSCVQVKAKVQKCISGLDPSDVQISPMSASVSIVPLLKKNKFEDIVKGGETV